MTLLTAGAFDSIQPITAGMRSARAVGGSIALLAALPLAILTSLAFGQGDVIVVHIAFGVGMVLLAFGMFDFRVPSIFSWIGCIGASVMAAIFLSQALAEIVKSPALYAIVYGDPTIQAIERYAAYPLIAWLGALLVADSRGRSRILGSLALAAVIGAEIYGLWTTATGGTPDIMLRLAYLPPFAWLIVEGLKRRG